MTSVLLSYAWRQHCTGRIVHALAIGRTAKLEDKNVLYLSQGVRWLCFILRVYVYAVVKVRGARGAQPSAPI